MLFLKSWKKYFLPAAVAGVAGCASHPPLETVDGVDLQRFMGTWYVHAYTPLLVDRDAVNPVEHYYLQENGKIATTYQFRRESVDAKLRTYTPTGTVYDQESTAEWRMQFIWPFKAPYLIIGLEDDYRATVIAHPNRKYFWVMSRNPSMRETDLHRHLEQLRELGFDMDRLQLAQHDWESESERQRKAYLDGLKPGERFTFR